ncbi:MAG: hypothetical protein ACK5MZ_02510 [Aestuariibaculum sp.]
MNTLKVLVVANQNVNVKILNWKIDKVVNVETALTILQQHDYKIIAVSTDIAEIEINKLRTIANLFNHNVSVVCFSNEEELATNVKQAFRSQKKAALNHRFLDNAFEMELACKINMN